MLISSFQFIQQVPDFKMTPPEISHSISGAIFMQGPGGLLAVPLAQRYGRLPVLFWSQFLTLVVSIGAYGASGYAGFTACRTLQGFFAAPPQVIGLSMIHDMFFFHERARKVNIWAFCFLLGPYLGPFISSFIAQKLNWRENFGVLAGFYGFSVLMVVLLGDETLFDREKTERKIASSPFLERVYRLTGVAGVRDCAGRPGLWEVTKDLFSLLLRPYLLLPTFGFTTWITMWTIGIVSTVPQFVQPPVVAGGYGFSNTAFALLHLAPMVGTVMAEFWGHWFNDFLCNRYIKKHGGQYKPENRLTGVYPAWIIGIAGLVLYGQTLQHHLHWVGLAFGWGMNCFSTLGTTVAISAYLLDVLPQHACLTAAWLNAFRTVGESETSLSFLYLAYVLIMLNRRLLCHVLPARLGSPLRPRCDVWLPSCYRCILHLVDYRYTGQGCFVARKVPRAEDESHVLSCTTLVVPYSVTQRMRLWIRASEEGSKLHPSDTIQSSDSIDSDLQSSSSRCLIWI